MKLYHLFLALIIFFPTFPSHTMDIVLGRRPLPRKYRVENFSIVDQKLEEVLTICTPEERTVFRHMFQSSKTNPNTLSSLASVITTQPIQQPAICFANLSNIFNEPQSTLYSLAQENKLKQEHLLIDAQNAELEKEIAHIEQEIEQQNILLEKKQRAKLGAKLEEKRIDEKIKNLLQMQLSQKKENTVASQKSSTANEANPVSLKEHRLALSALIKTHKIDPRNTHSQRILIDTLYDISTNLYKKPSKNNADYGPYFDLVNHVLFGQINSKFTYIYSPCQDKISIHKANFTEVLQNITLHIKQEMVCSKDCQYYAPKKNLNGSSSEEDTTSNSSHSSDMDTSSDGQLELVETT
jgi:hypothetical protein